MKPTLIGIGVQKCATSWAHAALGAHPQITASEPKEIDYFSYRFDHGHRWYEAHFTTATPHRFEISPSYFHDPRAPQRLAAYAPGIRLLVLLRCPVDRAFSNHLHEIAKGHIPAIPFEDGLANNPAYVEQGLYHTHLSRWFAAFPADRIHVAFAEDTARDPQGQACALYRFLGLAPPPARAVVAERRNRSDQPRSATVRSILRSGGAMLRRAGLEEELARIKKLPPVRAALNANSIDIRSRIPPMHPATRARLEHLFAPELAALPALIGRPLPFAARTDLPEPV
ncbi:sulfotransferase domain-containing protein [Algicella marina]|uniref:Sulfotransferase n=1 Tax=Algicella marina TaxID=2683284 RepID=A0A6P1T3Z0_9RHOB|nr:sulfotransferase domain-containing protein [Algicella marina]QHQ36413.1 sulfotransferase [Algicella marina]